MGDSSMCISGTGISFQDSELATKFGFDECGMQSSLLPSRMKRRTSIPTRMAFAAAERACNHAGVPPSELPTIFASALGESAITDRLCRDIAEENLPLSPTRFHNSVHNTASGYWSIAVGSNHPAMAMASFEDTFALGLLEAYSQIQCCNSKVLLVCYDETPSQALMPDNDWAACAAAFVISPEGLDDSQAPRMSSPYCEEENHCDEKYQEKNPALAALSLLHALAQGVSGKVRISASEHNTWFVDVSGQRNG